MIEGESNIIAQFEKVAHDAQPEKVNVPFPISQIDAAIIRDSMEKYSLQYGMAIPLLKGIQEGVAVDVTGQGTAVLSLRELELVNTALLARMRELRESTRKVPVGVQNAFINTNLSYLQNGGAPSEQFQEFCENMTR